MADETEVVVTPPDVKDVAIIKTPSGRTDQASQQEWNNEAYQIAYRNAKLSRQHRAVVLALKDMSGIPAAVTALGITAGVGYNQAQVQSIIDKLDATIAALNAATAALTAVKTTATENVISL